MIGSSTLTFKLGKKPLSNISNYESDMSMEFFANRLPLDGDFSVKVAQAIINTLTPNDKKGRDTSRGALELRTTARKLQADVKQWLSTKGGGASGGDKRKGKGKGGANKKTKKKK